MPQTDLAKATEESRPTRKAKGEAKNRMKGALMFLPNMVKLCGKLLTDSRVSTADKALFGGAIIYAIMPLDLIPDVLPFIGQVDDVYLIALTLLRLLNRTDESVIREHWTGGGDIVSIANSIAGIAPMILPKRISRVLSSHVDLADAGKTLSAITKKRSPIAVERPEAELEGGKKK